MKTKRKTAMRAADFITVILTLIICFFIVAWIFDYSERFEPAYSAYSFCYHLVNDQYGYAVSNKQVIENDDRAGSEYTDYSAVCDYIEADFLTPVYEKLGESANIERLNESKENAKRNIGELSPMLPVIDSNFSN